MSTSQKSFSEPYSTLSLKGRAKQIYEQEISKFLEQFRKFAGIAAAQAEPRQLSKYLKAQLEEGLSLYQARIHRAAIQRWYKEQYGKRLFLELPKEKQVAKRLRVLSHEEIELLFQHLGTHVCATLLRLIYTSGLRLNEALDLKSKDIDFCSLKIHVCDPKGKLKRKTVFSASLKNDLRLLLRDSHIDEYIFSLRKATGGKRSKPLSRRTPQLYLTDACREANLGRITISDLRDNFAIHLLQTGLDWHYLTDLMGFRNKQSVLRYKIYVSSAKVNIFSPLDHFRFSKEQLAEDVVHKKENL